MNWIATLVEDEVIDGQGLAEMMVKRIDLNERRDSGYVGHGLASRQRSPH